jgi:hypothetical protein
MKKSFILLILIILSILLVFHQAIYSQPNAQTVGSVNRVGTTAAQFLKITAGARPVGMGGAYTAVSRDILAVFWNPAGLSRIIGNGEAVFNHAEWLVETDYDIGAFSLNLGRFGAFGAQVISFRTPDELVRTIDAPEGTGQTWDANMVSLGVSYAINLTDKFSIGLTGKYIQEKIFNAISRGGAVDFGILYDTPLKNLTLGASITNFGTKLKLDGRDIYINNDPLNVSGAVNEVPAQYRMESYDMPLNLRFGLVYKTMISEYIQVLTAVDGVQPNDNSEYLNLGAELGLRNIIFLRAGYKSLFLENSEQGLTFGAGIQYDVVGSSLKFDFGWADYGRLKNVQFVSFAIRY